MFNELAGFAGAAVQPISESATFEEVKELRRKLLLALHPDKVPGPAEETAAEKDKRVREVVNPRFDAVSTAWQAYQAGASREGGGGV